MQEPEKQSGLTPPAPQPQVPRPPARAPERPEATPPRFARGSRIAPLPVGGDAVWHDPSAVRWRRRLLSIPAMFLATALYTMAAPVLLVYGAARDLWRGHRQVTVRFHLLMVGVLWMHIFGLLSLFVIWLGAGRMFGLKPRWWHEANRRYEAWWVTTIVGIPKFLYNMEIRVQGDDVAAQKGPILLFSRHISIIDTILPIRQLSGPHGMTLRIVKKAELLWDACVDSISHRLPRTFVQRGSGDADREISRVESLLAGVGERDAVCIFPEGTRYTPEKRKELLGKLRRRHPEIAARAERLKHLLPPKPGGALALINRRPDIDVVFCAHSGLEGAVKLPDFAGGVLLDRTVKIRYWRVSAQDVPTDPKEQVDWLFFWWEKLDRWLDTQIAGRPPTGN